MKLSESCNLKESKRKLFSKEEDITILYLINERGLTDWKNISKYLSNRSSRQIRERYKNYLQPFLINSPWKKEEDEKLISLYTEYGPKWSLISSKFGNRSDISIKNRWNSINKLYEKKDPLYPQELKINFDFFENFHNFEIDDV